MSFDAFQASHFSMPNLTLDLVDILFWFFLLSLLVWWCQPPSCPTICRFPFSPSVLILSWFGSSIPSVRFDAFQASHFSMPNLTLFKRHIFLCQIPLLCHTEYSNYVYSSFQFFFLFLLIVWCRPCTLCDWYFLVIY